MESLIVLAASQRSQISDEFEDRIEIESITYIEKCNFPKLFNCYYLSTQQAAEFTVQKVTKIFVPI